MYSIIIQRHVLHTLLNSIMLYTIYPTFFLVLVEALHVSSVCALVVGVSGAQGGGEEGLDEGEDNDLESYVYIERESV